MHEASNVLLAASAVLFMGLSKAGFGGGLGMLTTPLCVLAFGPRDAIGILLPLLCAGDAFSLYHYWGKWERRTLKYFLPGVTVGVVIGAQLFGVLSARALNLTIGGLALAFLGFQFIKEKVFRAEGKFAPNHAVGLPCGIASGVTSTIAHGAGPIVSLYLIPQQLPKEIYVGTTVLVFTWINWIKLPFFCLDRSMVDLPVFASRALITADTLTKSLTFLPLIPAGVWLGVWLNRNISERAFLRLVYALTLLTGLHLIFDFNVARLFGE